jgi:hypothetical protein
MGVIIKDIHLFPMEFLSMMGKRRLRPTDIWGKVRAVVWRA